MAGVQFLSVSGHILAKSLVPEPKTSLKCSLGALVSGTKLSFSKKKITFFSFFPSFVDGFSHQLLVIRSGLYPSSINPSEQY